MPFELKAPRLVVVGVLTLITVVFWVIFSVYQAFMSQPDLEIPAHILAPIDPTLDSEALTILDNSIYLSEEEIGNNLYGREDGTAVDDEFAQEETEDTNETETEEATASGETNE